MASIYGMVRLLPANHPYLNPANIGRFGVRHVVAEAANHLIIDRRHIDQIIIFSALLVGAALLFLQFAMLGYSFLVAPAQAQMFSMFATPEPRNDIAFLLLDRVFGVPRLFCSYGQCTHIQGDLPAPFHDALHALWQFYSIGLLCVGVLIFLYFVVVVVVETAVSGSPFGQRFEDLWVPIRLVVALALLVPINWGLNSAQYITLYAAKFGSGFATNAWLTFNNTVLQAANNTSNGANPIGEEETLIALSKPQDVAGVVQAMSLAKTCAYAYSRITPTESSGALKETIFPYFVKTGLMTKNKANNLKVESGTTYQQALEFYDNNDIVIRFGKRDEKEFKGEKGNVMPYCGEIRIKATPSSDSKVNSASLSGAQYISDFYFRMILEMWFDDERLFQGGVRFTELNIGRRGDTKNYLCGDGYGCNGDYLPACSPNDAKSPCMTEEPGADWKQNIIDDYQAKLKANLKEAWRREAKEAPTQIDKDVLERGWAGAGIWYNKIAELNGAFMGATLELPRLQTMPRVMEKVRKEKLKKDANLDPIKQYDPVLAGKEKIKLEGQSNELEVASALNADYLFWNTDDQNQANQEKTRTSNMFEDAINMIFGTEGLMDIRGENANIHPLAQLVAVGKSLVETTLRNLAISTVFAAGGGFMSAFHDQTIRALGGAASAIAGFFNSVSFIGLTAGLTLFYVLPFMPFVYFYFTVGTWIKSIFEAMVGVPLWALAHLRIDGKGLSGEAASSGYFLIFEIFLRPILAVFGLIAAIVIFSSEVRLLNYIWDLVVANSTGYVEGDTFTLAGDIKFKRSIIDQFFFTVIYTIIVYLLAITSFKLIDTIPDGLLRWMNAGVSTFSDVNEDPTEGLKRYVAAGGMTFGGQITGGIDEAAKGIGGSLGGLVAGKPTAPKPGGGT